jgi:hypothetical protein
VAEATSLVGLVVEVNNQLTDADVGHGFGGALALAYYVAEPRSTRDMDINLSVPVEEARRVFELLPRGVAWSEDDVRRCIRDGQIRLWHGRPRDGIAVDLFFPQHEFHAAVAEATAMRPFARADYLLPVIAAAHLVVFKALFDRPKDWVDIAAMLDAGTVDVAEALRWLVSLLGTDDPRTRRLVELIAERETGRVDVERRAGALPVVDWKALGR